ncbi:MAG: hypothetical protein ACI8WB_003702 [Phenylobacterium sp.]|jgi:hypothetical protein
MAGIKNKQLFWFASFNFVIFTTVFLGRILRDSLLFTAPAGDQYFPWVLIINAVLMTWFGGKIEQWWETYGAKKIVIFAFGGSAFWFFVMGCWLQFDPPTWVVALFYLGTELPIFLAMNLIWILADDYFTEQQGQRDFPQISAVGQFGIVVASLLILSQSSEYLPIFSSQKMVLSLAVLNLLVLAFALGLIRNLKSIRSSFEFTPPVIDDKPVELTFLQQAKADYQWAKKIRFLWLFTLATVCNFILLGIFDQTLANGAAGIIAAEDFSQLLARWTFGFGIFAALFQWFVFPLFLDKMGVAKLNLFAPISMLIGTFTYLVVGGDFFATVWGKLGVDPLDSLGIINILLFARICGWVAEFLFNQTLLPLVYGVLPADKVSRGRFFVEGPVTAITNGAAGLFLLGYFTLFRTTSAPVSKTDIVEGSTAALEKATATGFQLDLLFVVALVTAIFMLYWSIQMIPEFKNILLERLRQGDDVDLEKYEKEFGSVDKTTWAGIDSIPLKNAMAINRFTQLRGSDGVPQLLSAFKGGDDTIKAAVIIAFKQLNARSAFLSLWSDLKSADSPPSASLIDAMSEGAEHFGMLADLLDCFERWLEQDCSTELVSRIVQNVEKAGVDGNIVIQSLLQRYSQRKNDKAAVKVMLELGSGKSYRQIADMMDVNSELMQLDWSKLANTKFFPHEDVLDAFAFMLSQCQQVDSSYGHAVVSMLERYPWLVWTMLYFIDRSLHDKTFSMPAHFKPAMSALPHVLLKVHQDKVIDLKSVSLFLGVLDTISKDIAPEFAEVDWSAFAGFVDKVQSADVSSDNSLSLYQYFNDQLATMSVEHWDVGLVEHCIQAWYVSSVDVPKEELSSALFELSNKLHKKFTTVYAFVCLFDGHYGIAEHWLGRRSTQVLRSYLTLIAGLHPESRTVFEPSVVALALTSDDAVHYDRALSFLQEGLPRATFNTFRDELKAFEQRLLTGQGSIPYLPEGLPNALDNLSAQSLWPEVANELGDTLLLSIMNMETKHA